jgi:hypothetical protein
MRHEKKWSAASLLSVMLVSGCVTTGANRCAGWAPIRLSEQSATGLTEQDAREILAHNEFGLAQGCW